MEEDAKIAAQKSGRLSFYVVNAIADGCTFETYLRFQKAAPERLETGVQSVISLTVNSPSTSS